MRKGKDIKYSKAKGEEKSDLDKFMLLYRNWAHGLFPKANFYEFTTSVLKFCHSKKMKVFVGNIERENVEENNWEEENVDVLDNETANKDEAMNNESFGRLVDSTEDDWFGNQTT